jgi:hypothetical protein
MVPGTKEVEAQWNGGLANDDLTLALKIDRNNLMRDPVRDPETTVAPNVATRRT